MSNNIQTGKIPANITSNTSNKSQKGGNLTGQKPDTAGVRQEQSPTADTVSMTDQVSRLQEIENMLGAIPSVNSALVAEISQLITEGNLEIDLERTASRLIDAETGSSDS